MARSEFVAARCALFRRAFQGRSLWKKRLPQILDTLIAVGRVRRVAGAKTYVYH